MKFSVDKKDSYCVFKLDETKLDSINAPKMKSELVLLSTEGNRNVILDLSAVQFIDSSGLSSILVGNRLSKEAKGTFVVASPNENVMRLLRISQLESVLNIVPTVGEATDMVLMDELERDLRG
jgi:anti-anti-sigma factor